jgi:hypothetical protein
MAYNKFVQPRELGSLEKGHCIGMDTITTIVRYWIDKKLRYASYTD